MTDHPTRRTEMRHDPNPEDDDEEDDYDDEC